MVVGPGSTLLFAPLLFLFGRNPAGIKVLLHLLALACIPVSYWLGWKISHNRAVAVLSGLIATLSPDLYFYSNYVMTDVPNILLVLLFCVCLLSALESMQPRWIFGTLLISAFAILLRSENILLLLIGASVLAIESFRRWLQNRSFDWKKPFLSLTLAFMIAVLPVLWWSAHNKRIYGFFGMSNYFGVVIYDGWVYYGDASHLAFSDENSPAIQKIKAATEKYPIAITDKNGFATGWETYPALIKDGYSTEQAMNLLKTAALDSIQKNKDLTLKLLFLKLQAGFRPEITFRTTYSLPGEPFFSSNDEFFDPDNTSFPSLIKLQRGVNDFLSLWYPRLYPIWMIISVLALTLSIFRQPTLSWVALIAVVATRIFIPLTLSVPFWRYTLAGWIPLQIITISWIFILANGIQSVFRSNPLYSLHQGGQSSGKIASL
jgi:4-amino-4-deoxy-L-arabinose transferase-like glycosyltransferase